MRHVNEPISVTVQRGQLVAFTWRGSTKRVGEVTDSWIEAGRWWEQEPSQTVYRVLTTDRGLFEIALTHTDPPVWKLLVVWD